MSIGERPLRGVPGCADSNERRAPDGQNRSNSLILENVIAAVIQPTRWRLASRMFGVLALAWTTSVVHAQPATIIDLADVGTDVRRFGRVHGSSGAGATGVPVAGGFDVDGDGSTDHALAAMRASPLGRTEAGEVHLIFGDGGYLGTIDSAVSSPTILKIIGTRPREATGSEIWIDDVTGDGLGDLLIARQNFTPDPSRPGAGAVTVVVGGAGLRELAATGSVLDLAAPAFGVELVTIVGTAATDRVGIWVRAGDATGDGVADLLFGADQENGPGQSHRGALYLVRGGAHLAASATIDLAQFGDLGATALAGHIAKMIPPPGSHEFHFGSTCALGDLDGNGKAELLASAALNRAGATLRADNAEPGSAHGLGGSLDGTAFIIWDDNFPSGLWPPGFTIALDAAPGSVTAIEGATANRKFGEELLGGLDFDNDGLLDLFVGDITGDLSPSQNRPNSGSGHVLYDAASLKGLIFDLGSPPQGLETTTIMGADAGDIAADTVVMGDFDGDGYGDLIVASPHARAAGRDSAGTLHVLFGGSRWPATIDLRSGLEPSPAELRFTLVQGAQGTERGDAGDTLCYSAAAGDVDGDGKTDLIGNEMLGNGVATDHVDVGNLILVSGEVLAGDSGSACPDRPALSCRQSSLRPSRLRMVNRKGDALDRFTWRWGGGAVTTLADFLSPDVNETAVYALCVYAGQARLFDVLAAEIPPAGDCDGSPCWSADDDGYVYADSSGAAGGITRLRLTTDVNGEARVFARAAGVNVTLPIGALPHPVVVQLAVDDGQSNSCWESIFTDSKRNDGRILRAVGD